MFGLSPARTDDGRSPHRAGRQPLWSRNGKEIFYRVGNKMMVVDVSATDADLTLSQPRQLFEQRYVFQNSFGGEL